MARLGYLLITAGFLAGAYAAVAREEGVVWSLGLPALAVGAVGIALVQIAQKRLGQATETVAANLAGLERSLRNLVEKSERFDAENRDLDVYAIHHRIDDEFMGDLDSFVQGRESIAHRFGLQAYADVMTHFANAERYLNRCWSASTDGYPDEVATYATRARDEFARALETFRRSTGGGAPSGAEEAR